MCVLHILPFFSVFHFSAIYTAYTVLKKAPQARNHLKRVFKLNYTPENANEFEKCYLMIADAYIQVCLCALSARFFLSEHAELVALCFLCLQLGKNDLAQELCQKVIRNNQSCAKVCACLSQSRDVLLSTLLLSFFWICSL